MIIYGSSFSPYVRKLLAYCEERGIAFELKAVGIGDPDPGYAAASPLKKMPAIDDTATASPIRARSSITSRRATGRAG